MAKQHFFVRLIPPRTTFVQDMSNEERALMGQHIVYTRDYFERGKVLLYGPVLAAGGPFGMAALEVEVNDAAIEFFGRLLERREAPA